MIELYIGKDDALSKAIARIDDAVDVAIARMDEAVEAAGQATFQTLIGLLCFVAGIDVLGATIILAEIGRDMSRFPNRGTLARMSSIVSWSERECKAHVIRICCASANPRACAKAHPG